MSDSSKKPGGQCSSVQALMQSQTSGLGKLLSHARVLNRLDQILASLLDPNFSRHCQVAELRDRCLILACSNAAFATRIRMISPQLLESFGEEGDFGIERMEIRIAPVNRPQPEARKKRTLSPAALQALGRFASDSGDAEIQAIFDRINARRNGE